MSKTIEERVLEMKFENGQFEQGIRQSTDSLEMLKKALNMSDATTSLTNIEKAVNGMDFSGINNNVDGIGQHFSAVGIFVEQMVRNLSTSVYSTVTGVISKLKSKIIGGGFTRALNIEQAKFQLEGLGVAWEDVAGSIDYAVKGTRYGLDVAAKASSQLVASGVALGDEMSTSLRAISGVAAMTNQEYDRTAQIFTTIAGNGKVMTQQLRQFSIDGLNAAAVLGKALGKTEEQIYDMVSKGEIDFKTFAQAMDDAFGEHAKRANETFSGALANMGAALGRLGADFIAPFLPAARDVMNSFTGVIDKFKAAILPVSRAVGDAMSVMSGRISYFLDSVDMTGFAERVASGMGVLRNALFAGDTEITNFERSMSGLKALFSIFGKIISAAAGAIGNLLVALSPLGHAFMTVAAAVGDFLVWLNASLESSNALETIFDGISNAIGSVINVVARGIDAFAQFFEGISKFDTSKISKIGSETEQSMHPATAVMEGFKSAFSALGDVVEGLSPAFERLGGFIKEIITLLGQNIEGGGLKAFLDTLNAGVLTFAIAHFMDLGRTVNYVSSMFARDIAPITSAFKTLRATFAAYRMAFTAKTIMQIGAGIMFMAVALKVLSTIPSEQIVSSLFALGAVIGELYLGVMLLTKAIATTGFFKLTALSGVVLMFAAAMAILGATLKSLAGLEWEGVAKGLIALGGSMAILVLGINLLGKASAKVAVTAGSLIVLALAIAIMGQNLKSLSELSLEEIGRGLLGLAGSMAVLVIGARAIGGTSLKLVATAGAILVLSAAMLVMSRALQQLSQLNMGEIGRGLLALGGILTELTIFSRLAKGGGGMIAMGAGLNLVAASMVIFSEAMSRLGNLSLKQIGKSMLAMGGALAEVSVAMRLMPKDSALKATGLLITAGALTVLADALSSMGGMSMSEIGHSLIELGGAIAILAVGLRLMQGAISGAAALGVAALGIAVLAPALATLAAIPIAGLITSLVALAASLGILIAAAYLASPVTPIIIALSVAFGLLGVGMLGIGLGLTGIATALAALASMGGAAIESLVNAIKTLATAIPFVLQQVGQGIINLITLLGNNADAIATAFGQILEAMLRMIGEKGPLIISTFLDLIGELLRQLSTKLPEFINYGIDMVVNVLNGLSERMPDLINAGVNMVVSVMNGIGQEAPRLVDAGVTMIIDFINGLAETIRARSTEVGEAAANLGIAIVEGVIKGLAGFAKRIGDYLSEKAQAAMDRVKGALGINSPSKVFRDEVGKPIAEGVAVGIQKDKSVGKAAVGMAKGLLKTTQNALKIHSPSVVFKEEVGRWIAEGITEGIKEDATAEEAMEQKAQNIVNAFKTELDRADLKSEIANLQFELWKAMNPESKTEEQVEKNLEYLDQRLELQQKKIEFLKDRLQQTIEEFGEASDQTLEAQKEYLQAQKDYYDTVNEINELKNEGGTTDEERQQYIDAQRSAMREAEKMMQELIELNEKHSFGWSRDEMQKIAAERTGYDEEGLRKALGLPTEKEIDKAVDKTADDYYDTVDVAFGGTVGAKFTDIGESYATNIGDAFTDEMANQQKDMVAAVVEAQKAVDNAMNGSKLRVVETHTSDPNVKVTSSSPIKASTAVYSTDANVTRLRDASSPQQTTTNITNNYSMTQNNTSPESLSEAKIYRQTSNLFSSLKNANSIKGAVMA